jgi:hypothetical protein
MNMYYRKVLFLICLISAEFISMAQLKNEHAENVPGKLFRDNKVSSFINGAKAMPGAKAASLVKTINKILAELYRSPQLNPPTGFNAHTGVSANQTDLSDAAPMAKVFCFLRYLIKSTNAGSVKQSEDGADLYLELNALNSFFDQTGNFWKECDEAHFPLFFEAIPITDSTENYIEINFKNYGFPHVSNNVPGSPIRIVLANSKPLLIPLTRKEFVQFLIARDKYRIKENETTINDEKKEIAQTKKNISDPVYQSVKSTLQQTIGPMEDQLKKLNSATELLQKKIAHFSDVINKMSSNEATAPARLDEKKQSDELFGLEQLVPAGRKEGVLLTRVNPNYYNASSNAPAVQFITVYYSWPTIGFASAPDYLQQTTIDVFHHLDFQQLKESMGK